jgi:hypothetical protein
LKWFFVALVAGFALLQLTNPARTNPPVVSDPIIKGKNVTGFSDTEEAAVKLTKVVPFLLEEELKKRVGITAKGPIGEFICRLTDC